MLAGTTSSAGFGARYTPQDVAVLTMMAQLTARGLSAAEAALQLVDRRQCRPSTILAATTTPQSAARGIARAARRMDVLTLRETLTAAVTAHGVVHTWHTLVEPAFILISRARYSEARRALTRRVLARCLSEVFATVP
ncbi:hypothetical protein GCM10009541_36670 [Micromonospora gifhornensis]|uniref:MerR HTH family regulatory protein n=1 Tax=Micromonospora gifhornensis TaxID=84594 RepID=A0ABQ4IMS9_9ACTN|nr:hypothetical protein Vgi01_58980 [Micromonospora gifhornensis]